MAISNWPADDRPREKLLHKGAAALSDAELLAIFLRTGCAGKSAVDLARELLQRFGSLRSLLEASMAQFCQAKGLGQAKFAQLQAVLEMARRHLSEELAESPVLDSSHKVKLYLTAKLRHRPREVFAALFLNTQHQLIAFEELSTGTIDSAAVYPREVVLQALHHHAAAVIFAHNHPSGCSEPSHSDHDITRTLVKALALLDIKVLDHLIVGSGEAYSFAENGCMP